MRISYEPLLQQNNNRHRRELDAIADVHARADRLCELNFIRHVMNVASDVIVQDAWARGHKSPGFTVGFIHWRTAW